MTDQADDLFWDATYAIVQALIDLYPDKSPVNIGLYELATIVESLPNFQDDPGAATERMLLDIQTVWYEETSSL